MMVKENYMSDETMVRSDYTGANYYGYHTDLLTYSFSLISSVFHSLFQGHIFALSKVHC